jgi:hypothetical protein
MADILLDNQAVPSTPASGKILIYGESAGKRLATKNDAGTTAILGGVQNQNTSDVTANAADTYLTGSNLLVPTGFALQVGTKMRWRIGMTKTGAGTAAPVWTIRVGTAASTADTARCTLTSPSLQTGVADVGYVDIIAVLRNIGASGVLAAILSMTHGLAATGFASVSSVVVQATSAGFDTTVAGLNIGVSANPGASGVWTHQVVEAEMLNL